MILLAVEIDSEKADLLRGPVFKRHLINNEIDFLTCENVKDIPVHKFFSYQDSDNFIYAFNLESIKCLIENDSKNPYTRKDLPQSVLESLNKIIKYEAKKGNNNDFNFKLDLSPEQQMKQKCVKIFQRFDELEHYSQVVGFLI